MLVYGQDDLIAEWVHKLIPHAHTGFDPCTAIGYTTDSGKLIAGFIYNDYHPHFGTIGLTMAATSPMWARRAVIHEILSYPFQQLKVYKIATVTPLHNTKALSVNAHIGFKREAILAHHFGKKRHAVIMRMLHPDYIRLFGERHEGQAKPAQPSRGDSAGSGSHPS